MKKTTAMMLLSALALGLAACGSQNAAGGGKGQFSQERSTAFKTMMPNFSAMGKVVKGEEPYQPDAFKTMAETFVTESQEPFKHFTQDPDGQTGDALPNVWSDAAAFKTAEDNFHAAVAKLNTAAQGGNLEEIKAAYGEVGASCKSCHDTFRKPK